MTAESVVMSAVLLLMSAVLLQYSNGTIDVCLSVQTHSSFCGHNPRDICCWSEDVVLVIGTVTEQVAHLHPVQNILNSGLNPVTP
jgi:hypothetical protein